MDDQAHQYNMFIENAVESVNVNLEPEKLVIETDLNILFLHSTRAAVFYRN